MIVSFIFCSGDFFMKYYLVGIKGSGIAFCLAKKFKKINITYK